MTPEQISAITAIATIMKAMGGLPVWGIIFLIVVGPWVGMIVITGSISKRSDKQAQQAEKQRDMQAQQANKLMDDQNEKVEKTSREFREHVAGLVSSQDKRFEAVVRMYENNVKIVNDYNSLSGDLSDIITLTVRTLEGLVSRVDNNQFCPIVRREAGKS